MNPAYAVVALRAEHRCEYCHAPEVVFNFPFEVEHIIPLAQAGVDDVTNLALARRSCNLWKAAHTDGIEPERRATVRLFHPRTDTVIGDDGMQQWITAQANLAQAHATFQHVAAALAPACRDQACVCGQWTPKQVAAHLAGWDREAARALHALLADAPEDLVSDIDRFNRASVDARMHLSWEGTCWELRAAHETLQHAIDTLIQAQTDAAGYLSWMDGRIADYAVHTAQVRAWLPHDRVD